MVATRGRTFKRPWRRSCLSSKLKSSSAPIGRKDSWCFHAVGSSNAPLLGSTAAEGLPRIGRTSIATRWRSCGLPQSASCSENFVIPPDVFGQTLRAKNSLMVTDAKLVEDAFDRRLSELPSSDAAAPSNHDPSVPQIARPQVIATAENTDAGQAKGIDKSILTVAAPRRYRNREHLRYVAQQACLVCGRKPSDPHHLGFTQPRALGRKVSDEFAVPLCRGHHRAVHRSRDERAWWREAGIDPIKVARRLWKETRGLRQRRSQRAALPRPHAATAPSDPIPKNEDISATATTQEEARSPDVPG